jgi:RHS repeat-associated protein
MEYNTRDISNYRYNTDGQEYYVGGVIYHSVADILSFNDYYPFGMTMPGRQFSSGDDYRYGFNGMESVDEISGQKNSYDFGARIYDSRIGRWLSLDPKFGLQPGWSPYKFAYNNPLLFIDPDGNTEWIIHKTVNNLTGKTKIVLVGAKSNTVMTDGNQNGPMYTIGRFNPFNKKTYYYDYAQVKTTTIAKDGSSSVANNTEILYQNGIRNKSIFFADKGDVKLEWDGDQASVRINEREIDIDKPVDFESARLELKIKSKEAYIRAAETVIKSDRNRSSSKDATIKEVGLSRSGSKGAQVGGALLINKLAQDIVPLKKQLKNIDND